jgi:hypothetical protein
MTQLEILSRILVSAITEESKTNSMSFSPQYRPTTAAYRRYFCQRLRVEGCRVVSATGPHGR